MGISIFFPISHAVQYDIRTMIGSINLLIKIKSDYKVMSF